MGQKKGEIKVFKDAGVGKAYMWDMDKMEWDCIGEVINPAQATAGGGGGGAVGGDNAGAKQYPGDAMFAAGEYDHVFDVDLGDGIMRKIPFNNGHSPYEASDKFLAREGLGRSYTEQIVAFLK